MDPLLAERAWRTLGQACDERIAVGKAADGLLLPFDLVDDGTEVRAPIAGLVAGLRLARNDISACRRFEELPREAQQYVKRIEQLIGAPIRMVSVGPERTATIMR